MNTLDLEMSTKVNELQERMMMLMALLKTKGRMMKMVMVKRMIKTLVRMMLSGRRKGRW